MSSSSTNKFLFGNFAPVTEELTYQISNIQGCIPADLEGRFYRIGPNPKFQPIDPYKYHWMDGDGMIHQVHFENGQAYYANRWVKTKGLSIEEREGTSIWGGINSPPDFGNPYGLAVKNTSNTALLFHGNRLFSLWEQGLPYEIDSESLETTAKEVNFNNQWSGGFSAHSKVDKRKQELITFSWSLHSEIHYGVFDKHFNLIHEAIVKLLGKPVFMHDFAITENYTLFFDTPQTFNLANIAKGKSSLEFDPSNGCRIGVMPRLGSEVRWYDIPLCHIPHTSNAYEEDGHIILEACRFDSSYALFEFSDGKNKVETDPVRLPVLSRWKIDIQTGSVDQMTFDTIACDFPRIHDDYVGYKHQYSYMVSNNEDNYLFNSLVKLDSVGDIISRFQFPEHCKCTEFVFAPRKNAQDEDDGYCIGHYHNEQTDTSSILILDAKRISKGPLATLQLEKRIPYGFHSAWLGK